MTDRRRINGPSTGAHPPIFTPSTSSQSSQPRKRSRKSNELRNLFIQTGLTPHTSGSAYLELESTHVPKHSFTSSTPTLKLSCSIQGPKPLSRNAPFSTNLQINASVKFAPFATRVRKGYVRDNVERDLGAHLENALNGIVILGRYPKSSLDVAVAVLEAEEDNIESTGDIGVAAMNVLAGCVNVAVPALIDAKIEVLDVACAGVAASIREETVLDPCSNEHETIEQGVVVVYLPLMDEVVDLWSRSVQGKGSSQSFDGLVDDAIKAAKGVQGIIKEIILENAKKEHTALTKQKVMPASTKDVEMKT